MTGNAQTAVQALNLTFMKAHPKGAARKLEEMEPEFAAEIFLQCDVTTQASVFEHLSSSAAAMFLEQFEADFVGKLMETVEPKSMLAALQQLEPETAQKFLQKARKGVRQELTDLMQYPENSAGTMMDTRFMVLPEAWTVEQALERVHRETRNPIQMIYLVDETRKLSGRLGLHSLVMAAPDQVLSEIKSPITAVTEALTPRDEVVELLEKHRLQNIPVVDIDGFLIGVIRADTLVTAVEEEATLDVQAMVGVSRDERALSPATFAVRKRQPWLQINLVTAFLAASVVGLFEDMIARYTALAILLPVVAGQSGNTGAQALAVTMRGLAIREITIRHWLRIVWKEMSAGFLNGLGVCATTCLGVFVWSGSAGLTLVIGISMVISMVIAGMAGAAVPLLLVRVGQDPATAASIILTTVTDVMGFFSFLGIATLLSRML